MGATENRSTLRGDPLPEWEPFPDSEGFPDPPTDDKPTEEPPVSALDDGTVVVRLTRPLMPHGGKGDDPLKDLTEVRLRPMYARDMLTMDAAEGDMEKVVRLAVKLAGLPTIAIERLHSDDFARVHGVVQGRLGKFLGASRPLWVLSLD